jgi:7,8-dihydro-6-hydroxymethylpterin dimethyltransferase
VERLVGAGHRRHDRPVSAALRAVGLPDDLGELAGGALSLCAACGVDVPEAFSELAAKAFMIVIQDFQDAYTLNVRQLMKCCVEEITPDGRLIPFCAYNSVGYREQVREQLSGAPVAPVVPNAAELADMLVPTRHGSRTVGDPAAGTAPAPMQVNVGSGLR